MNLKRINQKALAIAAMTVLPSLANAQMGLPTDALGGAGGLDIVGSTLNGASNTFLATGISAAQPLVTAGLPYVGILTSQGLPIATSLGGPLAGSLLALQFSGTFLNTVTAIQQQDVDGAISEASKFPGLIVGGASLLDPAIFLATAENFDPEKFIKIGTDLASAAGANGLPSGGLPALPVGDLPALPAAGLPSLPGLPAAGLPALPGL